MYFVLYLKLLSCKYLLKKQINKILFPIFGIRIDYLYEVNKILILLKNFKHKGKPCIFKLP